MFPCFVLASITSLLLGWLMGFLSVFLILLVLIQRGRGGGLTGALGGAGGQSAFGSKAGDTFTVITVVVASVWGFSCAFTMWLLGTHAPRTTVTDSSVTPGPGDRREVDDDAASRSLPSDSIGGLLNEEDDEAAEGESNDSADGGVTLTPAERTSDEEPSDNANESADANDSAERRFSRTAGTTIQQAAIATTKLPTTKLPATGRTKTRATPPTTVPTEKPRTAAATSRNEPRLGHRPRRRSS